MKGALGCPTADICTTHGEREKIRGGGGGGELVRRGVEEHSTASPCVQAENG